MTRQRQILVTVTYNDLGCIIDTKTEPYEELNLQPTCNQLATVAKDICVPCKDSISRQAAIDAILAVTGNSSVRELYEHVQEHGLSEMWSGGVNAAIDTIIAVPSVQPELTDDRAIEHLQSTGWMQNHDKEMYEMGLREQLADDGGSYDSLIPSGDTILRQAAIDAIANCTNCGDEKTLRAYVQKHNLDNGWTGGVLEAIDAIEDLPSAQSDIIRCNACKHWTQTTGNMPGFGLGDCDYLNAKLVSCNGFCYWAERRTDE